jgi:TolA-binding protein
LGYHFYRVARISQRDYDKFIKKNSLKNVMAHETEIRTKGVEEAIALGIIPEGTDIPTLLEGFEQRTLLNKDYQKSAIILSRMAKRFPGHPQAVVCGLTAGDCYRKGKMNDKAIEVYKVVASNKSFDSESRAEALYWNGKIFKSEKDTLNAYSVFMEITIDFPETKAAKWARAELAKKEMVSFDLKLVESKIHQK